MIMHKFIVNKKPIFILIIFTSMFVLMKLFGVMINVTPSMKEGIYIRAYGAIKRGDIVAACLPEPYKTIGLKNLYIEKGSKCDGADPVIKKIIAVPGDDVILDDNYIIVNNTRLPFKTLHKDSSERVLNIYPRCRYLRTNGYWLIGTDSPKSWDSRYWGFIKKEHILYGLKKWNA
jgi:conjugative transfer signal peptidase TraF